MGNHFDIASKYPFDVDPAGMLQVCGVTVDGPVVPYKTDLSTRLDADRLFRIDGNPPWLAHVELQSGPEQCLDLKIERYNICTEYQVAKESKFHEHLPVISTLMLLHPRADSPTLTGNRSRIGPSGNNYGSFRYNVVRIWEIPVEMLLTGPLVSLAFAVLAKTPDDQLPAVVERIEERLASESASGVAKDLRTCGWLLMGLRFTEEFIRSCPWRVDLMHESSTYQQLMNEGVRKGRQEGLQEGLVKGKRDAIVKVGQKNLGPVSKSIQKSLDAIVDPIRLDLLLDQVSSVQSWNELLRVGTSGK